MKMETIEGSETSEIINQTPGNYPKGNLLYSVHGEILKSGKRENYFKRIGFSKFRLRNAEISRHRINWLAFSVRMIDLLPEYVNLRLDQPFILLAVYTARTHHNFVRGHEILDYFWKNFRFLLKWLPDALVQRRFSFWEFCGTTVLYCLLCVDRFFLI